MRYEHVLGGISLALFLTTCSGLAAGEVPEMKTANALLTAEIETKPERITLNQDYLVMERPGAKQYKLPVVLAMRVYRLKVLRISEKELRQSDARLFSYELCAVSQEELFNWDICSSRPLGMFKLFSNERAENYLAWVESRTVCFTKIAEPRDRLATITDAVANDGLRSPEFVRVPTDDLIPREYQHPKGRTSNAFYSEFSIEALEVRAPDDVILKVAAPGAEKVFTLVFDGKEWREKK